MKENLPNSFLFFITADHNAYDSLTKICILSKAVNIKWINFACDDPKTGTIE